MLEIGRFKEPRTPEIKLSFIPQGLFKLWLRVGTLCYSWGQIHHGASMT